jgi:hypothetical protein
VTALVALLPSAVPEVEDVVGKRRISW